MAIKPALEAILVELLSMHWDRASRLWLNNLMMLSELSFKAFRKNSAVIGGAAAAAGGPGAGTLAAEVSISRVSREMICLASTPGTGAWETSPPFLGCAWRSEVSLDCVRVGCGVRFMITLASLFVCRAGDAESAATSALTAGLAVQLETPWVVPSGVLMSSSDDESSSSSVKLVGLGDGVQPVGPFPEGSRFGARAAEYRQRGNRARSFKLYQFQVQGSAGSRDMGT